MCFDHIVIGGGIVGCATAYFLSADGARVLLLEEEATGAGASGGPGMRGVRMNNRDPRELALAREAQALWPTLDERLGFATGFERRGGLELFELDAMAAAGGLPRLHAKQAVQDRYGIRTEVIDRERLDELLPGLTSEVTHAVWSPGDGVAPQSQSTEAFRAAAVRLGATVLTGARATTVRETTTGAVVQTAAQSYETTGSVLIAANTGTRALVEASFNITLPLWDTAYHAWFFRPDQPYTLPRLIGHDSRKLAAKQVGDMVQISGFLTAPWDATAGRSGAGEELFAQSAAVFHAVFPSVGEGTCVATEGRRDTTTPDALQIIDRVPTTRRVFVAAGWSGHGFATAPSVGVALSAWMRSGERPDLLSGLGAARFGL